MAEYRILSRTKRLWWNDTRNEWVSAADSELFCEKFARRFVDNASYTTLPTRINSNNRYVCIYRRHEADSPEMYMPGPEYRTDDDLSQNIRSAFSVPSTFNIGELLTTGKQQLGSYIVELLRLY